MHKPLKAQLQGLKPLGIRLSKTSFPIITLESWRTAASVGVSTESDEEQMDDPSVHALAGNRLPPSPGSHLCCELLCMVLDQTNARVANNQLHMRHDLITSWCERKRNISASQETVSYETV